MLTAMANLSTRKRMALEGSACDVRIALTNYTRKSPLETVRSAGKRHRTPFRPFVVLTAEQSISRYSGLSTESVSAMDVENYAPAACVGHASGRSSVER